MKLIREFIAILIISVFIVPLSGQQDSILSLSLEQAKVLALENNNSVKNARLDIIQAKKRVREATAMGLPHAELSGSYQYQIAASEFVKGFIEDGVKADTNVQQLPQSVQDQIIQDAIDDTKTSMPYDFVVSQLVFSGAYIVALQTAKIYKSITNLALQLTEKDVLENVINSYYMLLISKENVVLLDSSLHNTQEVYEEMLSIYDQGFIDETDVDQLKLVVQTIKNTLMMIKRQSDLAERLLKYQLGVDLSYRINLTDDIDVLIESMNLDAVLGKQFNLQNDINYKLMMIQEDMTEQGLRLKKSEFLPTVSAFYNYHQNLNENAFEFQAQDIIGVSVSVPIFSSGERISRVSQAKIELEKTRNSNEQASRGIILAYEQNKSDYLGALENMELTRDNMNLSKQIYDRTLAKFGEGMASNADIIQAQNQYLDHQAKYYQTIITLVSAKLKLDKALNNF